MRQVKGKQMQFDRDKKLIINLAPTGMIPRKSDTPYVPITPDEIAADVEKSVKAGAAIAHLHAREDDGEPTYRKGLYAEIIGKVRERCPDVIVCVSCSGRNFKEFEKRSEVLHLKGDLKPDMASLTLGSMNFPKQASVNDPEMIRALAQEMTLHGIVPEMEVFELGMLEFSHYLIRKEILQPPFYANILLGSLGTLGATPYNLVSMVQALPPNTTWAATGIGRYQFYVHTMAITMGGNVRVGVEDNIYYDDARERLATNPNLVERVVNVAKAAQREIATPAEARAMIGLPPR